MNVLLDTSAYSALQRGDRRILTVMQRSQTVAMPVIVLGELHSGFRSSLMIPRAAKLNFIAPTPSQSRLGNQYF